MVVCGLGGGVMRGGRRWPRSRRRYKFRFDGRTPESPPTWHPLLSVDPRQNCKPLSGAYTLNRTMLPSWLPAATFTTAVPLHGECARVEGVQAAALIVR